MDKIHTIARELGQDTYDRKYFLELHSASLKIKQSGVEEVLPLLKD